MRITLFGCREPYNNEADDTQSDDIQSDNNEANDIQSNNNEANNIQSNNNDADIIQSDVIQSDDIWWSEEEPSYLNWILFDYYMNWTGEISLYVYVWSIDCV